MLSRSGPSRSRTAGNHAATSHPLVRGGALDAPPGDPLAVVCWLRLSNVGRPAAFGLDGFARGCAMTARRPCPPAPGPLEDYAAGFDDLFGTLAQRRGFREYP